MTIDLLIEGFPAGKGAVRNGYRRNPSQPRPLQPVSVGFVGDDDGDLGRKFITGTGVNQGLKV